MKTRLREEKLPVVSANQICFKNYFVWDHQKMLFSITKYRPTANRTPFLNGAPPLLFSNTRYCNPKHLLFSTAHLMIIMMMMMMMMMMGCSGKTSYEGVLMFLEERRTERQKTGPEEIRDWQQILSRFPFSFFHIWRRTSSLWLFMIQSTMKIDVRMKGCVEKGKWSFSHLKIPNDASLGSMCKTQKCPLQPHNSNWWVIPGWSCGVKHLAGLEM